jgi:creatinine amidohydrolase
LSHAIARLTAPEVAARIAAGAAILLPLGSTETHGPAATMGDYLLAEAIALAGAEAAKAAGDDALVLPPLPFGGEDFFRGVPGGISLTHATLSGVIRDSLESLRAAGAGRLLVVSGHGGNIPAIEEAQRRFREAHGQVVPVLHLWREVTPLLAGFGVPPETIGHGGNPVLGTALHLFPELCRPWELAPRAEPAQLLGHPVSGFGTVRVGGVHLGVPVTIQEIAPGGTQAIDPRGATAVHGQHIVAALAAAIRDSLAAMKEYPA